MWADMLTDIGWYVRPPNRTHRQGAFFTSSRDAPGVSSKTAQGSRAANSLRHGTLGLRTAVWIWKNHRNPQGYTAKVCLSHVQSNFLFKIFQCSEFSRNNLLWNAFPILSSSEIWRNKLFATIQFSQSQQVPRHRARRNLTVSAIPQGLLAFDHEAVFVKVGSVISISMANGDLKHGCPCWCGCKVKRLWIVEKHGKTISRGYRAVSPLHFWFSGPLIVNTWDGRYSRLARNNTPWHDLSKSLRNQDSVFR